MMRYRDELASLTQQILVLTSLYYKRVTIDCEFKHFKQFGGNQCNINKIHLSCITIFIINWYQYCPDGDR